MSFDLPTRTTHAVVVNQATQNQVLRQTYMLLAITLVPTILGAAIGVNTGFSKLMMASPIVTMAVFLIGSFWMMHMVQKNSTTSTGITWLMVFTFFMGLMLSRMLGVVWFLSIIPKFQVE